MVSGFWQARNRAGRRQREEVLELAVRNKENRRKELEMLGLAARNKECKRKDLVSGE